MARVAGDNGLGVAVAQLERLEKSLDRLAAFPQLDRARRDLGENTFTLPVRPWVIIYDLVEGDVEVLRIVDGRRDLSALLDEPR
ncbi:type II toxin-antitoxin system RelE/ParE family toxin [Caulobacter sp. UNC358MFTsu5.1]|uniref:type II toxin-antitoxin system RelE/ParE family toxin n=1 Tax=Caulobacter sp. UNC358MFTsu5.1 TaxID=1449049 RepID=UPI00068A351D|nr:type II toxin-antitoxin system RelE/ParE family toxin [Caulobacter sp. UNC358MFTsu5.1]